MIALVTGGAGFIGSHVVDALEAEGARVRVLDDLSSGSRDNLRHTSAELVVGDINDAQAVRRAMDGVDTVFHLAAMISVAESMEDPGRCYRVNVLGSLNVLEAARRTGVSRAVLSSSCAVYGAAADRSAEADSLDSRSPYAASKIAMEELGRLYATIYGLPTVTLRYFNVYGPRQSPASAYAAVIPAFVHALLEGRPALIHGDGTQSRDFVFVEDVARANLLAARLPPGGPHVVNVGSGQALTVLELATRLARILPGGPPPTYGPPRPGDLHASCSHNDLARDALGFRPATDMDQGLRRTVEWMQGAPAPTPATAASEKASGKRP